MKWTIKARVLGLACSGIVFVACVSATGYWGIESVSHATGEVAGIGVAIRNNLEAGIFNDMTREDINAICTKTGQDQQDALANLAAHSRMLEQLSAAAREPIHNPETQPMMDAEVQQAQNYLSAADALSKAVVRSPSTAAEVVGQGIQLYSELQQQISDNNDELEKTVKQAEAQAGLQATRASRAMFSICGLCLLLLLTVSTLITVSIIRPLNEFSSQFTAMTEARDLTVRVDEGRGDEIGDLGRRLNLFVGKVHDSLCQIAKRSQSVAGASEELFGISQRISANSEETSAQAEVVSRSSLSVSRNLQTLASGAEGMGACLKEVANASTEAARVATSAVSAAEKTTATVSKLRESSAQIVHVIQRMISTQSAAVEMNPSGEEKPSVGTANAAKDISGKIEAMQADTAAAVEASSSVSGVINKINGISGTIAAAVEEQNATTDQMTLNAREAAASSGEITSSITGVAHAAQSTATGARDIRKAAERLVETSAELRRLVREFKIDTSDASAVVGRAAKSMAAQAGG